MTAAAFELYHRTSLPQRLQAAAVVGYLAVFAALVASGRPGIGIGQAFYIPIVLVSLGGGTLSGAAAGVVAAALYDLALVVDAEGGAGEPFSVRIAVHLVTYAAAGAIVGYFAARARQMLSESLHALEDLLHLARRDLGTGALNPRGLETALGRRIAAGGSFGFVVGEIECRRSGEPGLREVMRVMTANLPPGAEVARVGPSQLAAVVSSSAPAEARAAAATLERVLDEHGCLATFGWALHPGEGDDSLTLVRCASERLYARRIVRGEWSPTAASAGLVDELAS
ncbi:MAG TPA: hypothetical protein VLN26_18760, partial [Gaiellaceae bacterium]|nr:hypothetical protein [Gaiellaceae bacterium]